MSHRVCFVYQWATYGGVERVFLNRAQAFADEGLDVDIEVFYGADGGGMAAFKQTIRKLGLEDRIRVVPTFDPGRYESTFIIDSPALLPEQLDDSTRWVVECHTPYAENREYLSRLPEGVADVLVPSHTFAEMLRNERPEIASRIRLLRNCVSPARNDEVLRLPAWKQQALLYFGRLDELKNPQGFIDIVRELERRQPGRYVGVVVGPEVEGYDMALRIDKAGLRGRVFQMPPLPFTRTGAFLAAWRERQGVMISPSYGESFGLAAAESIAAGVPVLLSQLPEHAELVAGDDRHLYQPDDINAGADRVEALVRDYPQASQRMLQRAQLFSSEAFVSDWLDVTRGTEPPPGARKAINEEVGS